jgi:hypothetical protein
MTVKTFLWFVDIGRIVDHHQTEIVNNSTNIDKPKESFNSDGQPFLQYQQIKQNILLVC